MGAMYKTDQFEEGELINVSSTSPTENTDGEKQAPDQTTEIDPGPRPPEHMTSFDPEADDLDESSADYAAEEQNPKERPTQ